MIVRGARPRDGRSQTCLLVVMLLAPSSIAVSATWGQRDMVSLLILLLGVACLPTRVWWLALTLFGWCGVMKSQLALAVVAILGVWLFGQPLRVALRRAAWSVVLTVCAPFGVGVPQLGARYSSFDRLATARERWALASMGAANIWQFRPVPDSHTVASLIFSMLGTALLLCCLVHLSLRWYVNRHSASVLLGATWLAGMFMWSYYMCATRCHERYLLPASVLLLLSTALSGWSWRRFITPAVISLVLFISVVVPLISWPRQPDVGVMRALSVVSILSFVVAAVASRPPVARADDGLEPRSGMRAPDQVRATGRR